MQSTLRKPESIWRPVRRSNREARTLADRHYSRKKPGSRDFVGPGECLILLDYEAKALFVWRRCKEEYRADNQKGVECAIFRNEGPNLSSEMILEAEKKALERWPDTKRFFSYVNPEKIKNKKAPGWCFKKAGWSECGRSKVNKLIILEKTVTPKEDP